MDECVSSNSVTQGGEAIQSVESEEVCAPLPLLIASLTDYVLDAVFSKCGTSVACSLSSNDILVFSEVHTSSTTDNENNKYSINCREKRTSLFSDNSSPCIYGQWMLTGAIHHAHEATIPSIDWCGEEFGILLGTCSHDGSAALWCRGRKGFLGRQVEVLTNPKHQMLSAIDTIDMWLPVANFRESNVPLTCFKFCPPAIGLRFAVSSERGTIMIYTADDVVTKEVWFLETFKYTTEVEYSQGRSLHGCPCLTSVTFEWLDFGSVVGMAIGGFTSGDIHLWRRGQSSWQRLQTLHGPQCLEGSLTQTSCVSGIAAVRLLGLQEFLIATAHPQGVYLWSLKWGAISQREVLGNGKGEDDGPLMWSTCQLTMSLNSTREIRRLAWKESGLVLCLALAGGVFEFWRVFDADKAAIPLHFLLTN